MFSVVFNFALIINGCFFYLFILSFLLHIIAEISKKNLVMYFGKIECFLLLIRDNYHLILCLGNMIILKKTQT